MWNKSNAKLSGELVQIINDRQPTHMQCVFATRLEDLGIEEACRNKTNRKTISYCWCENNDDKRTKQNRECVLKETKKKRQKFHTKRY